MRQAAHRCGPRAGEATRSLAFCVSALTSLGWPRRAELKYEIDKIQASQRLDLNLEKGRIRDELLTQNSKSIQTGALVCHKRSCCLAWAAARANLHVVCAEIRLDKEINSMRTTLEVRTLGSVVVQFRLPHTPLSQANKNDIIRFCVGAVASTTAVGLGILRLVL